MLTGFLALYVARKYSTTYKDQVIIRLRRCYTDKDIWH